MVILPRRPLRPRNGRRHSIVVKPWIVSFRGSIFQNVRKAIRKMGLDPHASTELRKPAYTKTPPNAVYSDGRKLFALAFGTSVVISLQATNAAKSCLLRFARALYSSLPSLAKSLPRLKSVRSTPSMAASCSWPCPMPRSANMSTVEGGLVAG